VVADYPTDNDCPTATSRVKDSGPGNPAHRPTRYSSTKRRGIIDDSMASGYAESMGLIEKVKLDRTVIKLAKLTDPPDDLEFWLTKSPQERLAGVELMRQIAYGYDPDTERLQRVLSVAQRGGC